jgi:hypothetical protein
MSQAWLGVVSRSHVWRGVEGGFAQVCHGKVQPLRKMKKGDIFVYYSPTVEMHGAPLKAFTALGEIQDDEVFEFDMGEGFVPFRRRVRYAVAQEVPLEKLREDLDLCSPPNWGIVLRRGLIPLTEKDIRLIASAMDVDLAELRRNR